MSRQTHNTNGATKGGIRPANTLSSSSDDGITAIHLFFRKKFGMHRILGLTYLIQLVVAVCLYLVDCEQYVDSL